MIRTRHFSSNSLPYTNPRYHRRFKSLIGFLLYLLNSTRNTNWNLKLFKFNCYKCRKTTNSLVIMEIICNGRKRINNSSAQKCSNGNSIANFSPALTIHIPYIGTYFAAKSIKFSASILLTISYT